MNRNRFAYKMYVVNVGRIFGARARENIMNLMPHLGKLTTQTKYMMVYAARKSIVIR